MPLFEQALLNSLATGAPITFFLSRCLRYYYPQGQLAVIGHTADEHYLTLSGTTACKSSAQLSTEILHDLRLPLLLNQLGINCEVVIPVMDQELRRPAEMNTTKNRQLARQYIQDLTQLLATMPETAALNTAVISGSELFDFDTDQQQAFFATVSHAIHYSNQNEFGIANYMFEAEVARVTGVFRDPDRLDKYNRNEFPRERVLYNTCDGLYMARCMTMLAPRSAGVLALMPQGGEYISKVYESNNQLCVYMPQ